MSCLARLELMSVMSSSWLLVFWTLQRKLTLTSTNLEDILLSLILHYTIFLSYFVKNLVIPKIGIILYVASFSCNLCFFRCNMLKITILYISSSSFQLWKWYHHFLKWVICKPQNLYSHFFFSATWPPGAMSYLASWNSLPLLTIYHLSNWIYFSISSLEKLLISQVNYFAWLTDYWYISVIGCGAFTFVLVFFPALRSSFLFTFPFPFLPVVFFGNFLPSAFFLA